MNILLRLQDIDRRIMYGLLCLIIVTLLLFPIEQPLVVTPDVRGVYDTIERIPHGQIAIISIVWSSSTMAENGPQTEAIMRHFFRRGVPFLIVPWDQQGAVLAVDLARKVASEMHKTYGVDWSSTGFKPPLLDKILPAMGKDLPGALQKDIYGKDLKALPMMKGIKNMRNIGLAVEVTPSGTLDAWIQFVQGVYHTPMAYAPTLVMAPEGYNQLDAKQIVGMLPGLVGAGQYEKLLDYRGLGQKGSAALSGAHMLIVILIILGNLGLVAQRRRRTAS